MGERKGTNKYYPPDFDPAVHGSLNGYHGVHALRERARKITQGILIIRFEAPWNFWCGGCGAHVERGVRYNAEKKRVGNYYTTPIWAFRMKCHLCDNHFVFETDPKNCDYKITEGARRKNEQWDPATTQVIDLPDDAEKAKRAADAMYRLEHDASDQARAKKAKPQLLQLIELKDRTTKFDYDTNAALRRSFRAEKKERQRQQAADDVLKERAGIQDLELLPEDDSDAAHARRVSFQSQKKTSPATRSARAAGQAVRRQIRQASIFGKSAASPSQGATSVPAALVRQAYRQQQRQAIAEGRQRRSDLVSRTPQRDASTSAVTDEQAAPALESKATLLVSYPDSDDSVEHDSKSHTKEQPSA
ncbi:uncharacterized protein MONBRDRAFT_38787 [Monosiga brevicollis MX1]|uniref:Coiled-coil domain-containing protein 130 n=1 Tax=Monosiga brevicollis TaxID=81824 RepID=A9VA52_MONBE|nr:uncharacterized protein MONBRDRAFT_38787 [Monosiga brevicollis MX1]EDQ85668.1 predicted protein [Monosiga brevicollis MX1]|eukprot:XP_001749617.1 hypothetical protein [Monosiga brevicollis MX1]